jgi:hypothetical protein
MIRTILTVAASALIAACGGSSQEPQQLASGTSTTQGGDASIGAALLVLPLQGPTVNLDRQTAVRVRLEGSVRLGVHYPAHGTLAVELTSPAPTGATQGAHTLAQGSADLPLRYSVVITLPAGETQLMARAVLRTTDLQGLPAGAMGHAEAAVGWDVTEAGQ